MKPTARSRSPSCNACASAGVHVNVIVAASAAGPSPSSVTAPEASMRAHERACSFLPAATTNSMIMGRLHAPLPYGRFAVDSTIMGRLHAPLPYGRFAVDSTTIGSAATVGRCFAHTGEDVVLELALGHVVVDERTRQHELLPREDLPHDVVGEAHPEAGRVDLGAVREQRLASLGEVVADVDERREVVGAIGVET